ncbi:MAG: hypothetical protein AB1485_03565 [Candidatus Thermoplasmatota archaeon]
MDLLEIRQKAIALVLEGRYRILWKHIEERGHEISEFEIKMTILHGRHAVDREVENRFVAFGRINDKNIRTMYEFILTPAGEYLLVITAFVD